MIPSFSKRFLPKKSLHVVKRSKQPLIKSAAKHLQFKLFPFEKQFHLKNVLCSRS